MPQGCGVPESRVDHIAGDYELEANNTMAQCYITDTAGNGGFAGSTTNVITANAWHIMAGVFDGSQIRVYFDGTFVASKNTSISPGSASTPLAIGGYNLANSNMLNGVVDEVRAS